MSIGHIFAEANIHISLKVSDTPNPARCRWSFIAALFLRVRSGDFVLQSAVDVKRLSSEYPSCRLTENGKGKQTVANRRLVFDFDVNQRSVYFDSSIRGNLIRYGFPSSIHGLFHPSALSI